MNSDIVLPFALAMTSLTLCISLLVGWASLGRPRHALFWAGAFGLAAVQWGMMGGWSPTGSGLFALKFITGIAGVGLTILLLAGFRARAGTPLSRTVMAAVLLGFATLIGLALATSHFAWAKALPHLSRALLLPFAAAALRERLHQKSYSDVFAASVLLVFASLSLGIGLLRLLDTSDSGEFARLLTLVGYPVAFANVGAAGLLLLATDLSNELQHLAQTDPLTGLLNRRGFKGALRSLARKQKRATLLVIDLNDFKKVNDLHGHAVGDQVLQEVASCLGKVVRADDVVARLGGDEFALVLASSNASGEEIADRIRLQLAGDRLVDLDLPLPSTSIGTATLSLVPFSLASALKEADQHLYAAKAEGRERRRPLTLVKAA